MAAKKTEVEIDVFKKIKQDVSNMDPVAFCQKYMTLDGEPYRLSDKGYRPYVDIFRYIGIKALEPNSKPLILLKSRQTAGSTMAMMLTAYFMSCGLFGTNGRPPIRIFHTFPTLEMANVFSKTKYSSLISSSVPVEDPNSKSGAKPKAFLQSMIDTSAPTNDSVSFKQFKNGNHVFIESIGVDGARLRGRTGEILFVDEVQATTSKAIGIATKMLTMAKYGRVGQGVQVYFGTPLKKGSDFQKMWQASSQQLYHLGCEKCGEHFALYTPGSDDWEKVWIRDFIVRCTKCGHEQDKRDAADRGKWVAMRDENEDGCLMVGFFINQLFMPMFSKEDIIAQKPENNLNNTERAYRNEVLGEFYDGDSSPITVEEIRDKCGDVGRKMTARISSTDKKMVVLGIDYGKKADLEQLVNPNTAVKNAGQSYSTAVVLSVDGPGKLNIEFATKFKRNDSESKKGLIDQIMRQYSVQLAIGDIGYSEDFSTSLHTAYGDRYLVSRAHSKVNGYTKFSSDAYPKEIVFERDHYIDELLNKMKKGEVRFPLGDYEKIAWLISHCSSMELKPSISRSGDPTIHYVKGSTPNDGFMALLNAYLAFKFLITKGFTVNNPILQEQNMNEFQSFKKKPMMVLANIGRKF